jgi:epoxide hydrolase 4
MNTVHVEANGLRFRVNAAGEGPLVLLLHGFPDLGLGWRFQVGALAAAGYRALAPDLRGYGGTDRPPGISRYGMGDLVADVVALVRTSGAESAALVGHDWGGVVAWYAAMHHPEIVERLVVLNAPHPALYARELRRPSTQALRSWYAGFFQLPGLPERVLAARDRAILKRVWRHGPAREPEVLARYVEAYSSPDALTPPLHYYRAARRGPRLGTRRVCVPTLVLWGDRDPYLTPALTEGLEDLVDPLRVARFPRAGHWLHHDERARVNEEIVSFLGGSRERSGPDAGAPGSPS